MTESPSRKLDQFIVRLPEGLRDRIKASADENNRSMNAEMVFALEKYLALQAVRDEDPSSAERSARYRVARSPADTNPSSGSTPGPKILDELDAVSEAIQKVKNWVTRSGDK